LLQVRARTCSIRTFTVGIVSAVALFAVGTAVTLNTSLLSTNSSSIDNQQVSDAKHLSEQALNFNSPRCFRISDSASSDNKLKLLF
jgi:hypothetical protein